MFNLEEAYLDIDTIEEGSWEKLGNEFPGVEFLIKGLSSTSAEKLHNRLQRSAKRSDRLSNGQLTSQATERILKEVIIAECVMDWRGLSSGGKPLEFSRDTLRTIMTEAKLRHMALAIIHAITDLERRTVDAQEEVVKN